MDARAFVDTSVSESLRHRETFSRFKEMGLEGLLRDAVIAAARADAADPMAFLARWFAGQTPPRSAAFPEPQQLDAQVSQLASGIPPVLVLPPDEPEKSDKWSLVSWLQGAGVHRAVAAALLRAMAHRGVADSPDAAIDFLRGLDRAVLDGLLRTEGLIEAIGDVVWQGIEKLKTAGATTVGDIHSKFEGAIEATMKGLDVFFGGLEGVIGGPNPNLHQAMADEHLQGSESTQEFTTSNYGVTTTSEIEWRYVVEGKSGLNLLGRSSWPEESVEKLPDRNRQPSR